MYFVIPKYFLKLYLLFGAKVRCLNLHFRENISLHKLHSRADFI
nr:unnamed protein product [uncultured bacterium]